MPFMGDNRYHSIFGGMKVHTTPCSVQCPANTDIPAYMERLRQGDVEGAAHILMEANPHSHDYIQGLRTYMPGAVQPLRFR